MIAAFVPASITVTARPLAAGNVSVAVAADELAVPCEFTALYENVQVRAAGVASAGKVAVNAPFGCSETVQPVAVPAATAVSG